MTTASRLHAGLAAIALVLAGIAAVAPSPARAAVGKEAIAVAIFAAVTVAAFVVIEEESDEDPQSP